MGPDERHHQEPEQGSDQCNDKSDRVSCSKTAVKSVQHNKTLPTAHKEHPHTAYLLLINSPQVSTAGQLPVPLGESASGASRNYPANPVRIRVTQIQLL